MIDVEAERGSLRVLVVDDSRADAMLVRAYLSAGGGYDVAHADSLDSALRGLDDGVRCVVLDLSLPDAEGLGGLEAVRQAAPDAAVVVLTGYADDRLGEDAVRLGAQDFLSKTDLSEGVIRRAVGQAVERRRQQRALEDALDALAVESARRVRAEEGTARAHRRFRTAFDSALSGMALLSTDGRFVEANPSLCDTLGLPAAALAGAELAAFGDHEQQALLRADVHEVTVGARDALRVERRLVAAGGQPVWLQLAFARSPGDGPDDDALILQAEDITERKQAESTLLHQTLHDPLTGLGNRLLLRDHLEQALARRSRNGGDVGLLFVDLDRFKLINDTLGHDAGDRLLVHIAENLRSAVRPSDTVVRLGGDEFVVLAEDVQGVDEVEGIADRVRAAIALPCTIDGAELVPTASVGIAVAAGRSPSADQLLSEADAAMYRAKDDGKDRSVTFNDGLRASAEARMSTEALLRAGLAGTGVHLLYQPIVDLPTGTTTGAEALVRLAGSDGAVLPPDEFIEVAEDSGLIVPLGERVLAEAVAQLARWRADGLDHLALHVNVSARQLHLPTFPGVIGALLDAHGVPASCLRLELTESTLMQATSSTIRALTDITDLGVRLGIDDFGTGWSSLTYLRRFPLHFLKVDRSFVSGSDHDVADRAIVRAVVALARGLRLEPIAEGIETQRQATAVQLAGCDAGQGFLYARPLTAEALAERATARG